MSYVQRTSFGSVCSSGGGGGGGGFSSQSASYSSGGSSQSFSSNSMLSSGIGGGGACAGFGIGTGGVGGMMVPTIANIPCNPGLLTPMNLQADPSISFVRTERIMGPNIGFASFIDKDPLTANGCVQRTTNRFCASSGVGGGGYVGGGGSGGNSYQVSSYRSGMSGGYGASMGMGGGGGGISSSKTTTSYTFRR